MPLVLKEYNGWRDYFTWAVHLWLSNDEIIFKTALSVIRRSRDPEKALKEYVESNESLRRDCLLIPGLPGVCSG